MDEGQRSTKRSQAKNAVEPFTGDTRIHTNDRSWNGNTLGEWELIREGSTQPETIERSLDFHEERPATKSLGCE